MPTKVGTSSESPTQKADDVRAPFDGPHKPGAKKNSDASAGGDSAPAYVVSVTKRDKDDDSVEKVPHKYDPQVLKAKARSLLTNQNIDPEQRRVLKEILGPEENK